MKYEFHLQHYSDAKTKHICPQCGKKSFVYYVGEEGMPLDETVGRCDHESRCGYHYTPSQYFHDHPELKKKNGLENVYIRTVPPLKPITNEGHIDLIPTDIVQKSMQYSDRSTLLRFLKTLYPPETVEQAAKRYKIGSNGEGATVFFQIDTRQRCHAGKIIYYDESTGHRVKESREHPAVSWVHSYMKKKNRLSASWMLKQCLFGEHLLAEEENKEVCLVEAEKTALICSMHFPEKIWLATGGKSQIDSRLDVLKGRKITVFPDVDAFDEWKSKLCKLRFLDIKVSDFLQKTANEEDMKRQIDIADKLLEYMAGKT